MNMRAPGMTYMKMPMFVWTWVITAVLVVAVMPVLAGAVTMMLMDINFGTSFFDAAGGGDPVLFQHVFWFFGHPEVYHHYPACVWSGFSNHSNLCSQAAVWLHLNGLRHSLDRLLVVYRVGSPHVYRRHANRR